MAPRKVCECLRSRTTPGVSNCGSALRRKRSNYRECRAVKRWHCEAGCTAYGPPWSSNGTLTMRRSRARKSHSFRSTPASAARNYGASRLPQATCDRLGECRAARSSGGSYRRPTRCFCGRSLPGFSYSNATTVDHRPVTGCGKLCGQGQSICPREPVSRQELEQSRANNLKVVARTAAEGAAVDISTAYVFGRPITDWTPHVSPSL
jgi:hypothetical protein